MDTVSIFIDINNPFIDINNSFIDINNSFIDINKYPLDAVSIFIDINKWIIDINKDGVGHITKRMCGQPFSHLTLIYWYQYMNQWYQ